MKWFLLLHFQFPVSTHFSILTNKEVVGAKVFGFFNYFASVVRLNSFTFNSCYRLVLVCFTFRSKYENSELRFVKGNSMICL